MVTFLLSSPDREDKCHETNNHWYDAKMCYPQILKNAPAQPSTVTCAPLSN